MGVAVMVREKYAVRLTPEERENLQRLVRGGKSPARMTTRARILLKTGDGWPAPQVAEALDVAKGTVYLINVNYSCRPTTITFASSPPVGSCQLRSADGLGLL